jgi:hypothetical protein
MHIRFALWTPLLALSLLPPSYAARTELAQIAVSGCDQLNQGGVCELKNAHELVVWHAGSEQLEAYVPEARAWVSHAGERVGAGSLYRVPVRAQQRSLQLRFGSRAQQLLQLRAAMSWPWQNQVEAADNVAARELLTGLLTSARADERAFVLYELARREYRTGQRAQGALHLQAAATLAQQLGRSSLARSCLGLLANHASAAHDFAASHAALARAESLGDPALGVIDAYGRALIANNRGVLAAELAALHDAATAYENARTWVERGAFELRGHVLNGLAMVSVLQGRLLRAHDLYASLSNGEQARSDACFRAITLSNLGWVELDLLHANAGQGSTSEDATRHLRESVDSYAQCRATASWRPAHARLSLAYDALRRGDLGAARTGIEAAGAFEDEPRMAQYRALLVAELELAEGHADSAAQRFAELHAQWQQTLSTEPAWRALEGLGRALAAQRRWPEAIERFEAAEQLLAQAARGVPDPSALTSFFGTHDHSARGLREAYLAVGQREQAFRALRRAQRRHLLALARDQRVWERATGADWQRAYAAVLEQRSALTDLVRRAGILPDSERAAAERGVTEQRGVLEAAQEQLLALLGRAALTDDERLRAPRTGELMVAWLRADDRVEAYAAFGAETRHIRYPQPPADGAYLEPLADWVLAARELSVLRFSEPQSLDVHALPFRGRPLIETLPVAYSLDLPPRAAELAIARELALLATDRRGDLVYAQRELDALERVLSRRGWEVTELSELSELQRPSVRPPGGNAALGSLHAIGSSASGTLELAAVAARPGLFYYAGHGRADDSGALRSALVLSDSELSIADILALRAAPARVVLSACEAARAPDLREAAGVSIAQAFVLAGSDEVLAPSRPVGDRAAELMSARVREGLAARQDLAALYQQALRAAPLDAYAFRLVVR